MTDILEVSTLLISVLLSSAHTHSIVNLGLSQTGDAAQEKLKTIKSTSSPFFLVLPKGPRWVTFVSFQHDPPRIIRQTNTHIPLHNTTPPRWTVPHRSQLPSCLSSRPHLPPPRRRVDPRKARPSSRSLPRWGCSPTSRAATLSRQTGTPSSCRRPSPGGRRRRRLFGADSASHGRPAGVRPQRAQREHLHLVPPDAGLAAGQFPPEPCADGAHTAQGARTLRSHPPW